VDDDLEVLERSCTRALAGHGPTRAADLLATIAPDTEVDRYGAGGVVAELEAEVAGLLGMPAAAYVPSGTMAQPAVLARAVADAVRGLPGVTVVPDPPQTPMLHLRLRTSPEAFVRGARELAEQGPWTWPEATPTADPAVQRVELPVGDATVALGLDEVHDAVALLSRGERTGLHTS
jgi:threonine aldolase